MGSTIDPSPTSVAPSAPLPTNNVCGELCAYLSTPHHHPHSSPRRLDRLQRVRRQRQPPARYGGLRDDRKRDHHPERLHLYVQHRPPPRGGCSECVLIPIPAPSFEVDPDHVQTLSFGTCRFFFENFSPFPMSNCWLSFVSPPFRRPACPKTFLGGGDCCGA